MTIFCGEAIIWSDLANYLRKTHSFFVFLQDSCEFMFGSRSRAFLFSEEFFRAWNSTQTSYISISYLFRWMFSFSFYLFIIVCVSVGVSYFFQDSLIHIIFTKLTSILGFICKGFCRSFGWRFKDQSVSEKYLILMKPLPQAQGRSTGFEGNYRGNNTFGSLLVNGVDLGWSRNYLEKE